MFKHSFLFFILIESVLMIKKYIGLYTFSHLKNAGRPTCMGHIKYMEVYGRGIMCVVSR